MVSRRELLIAGTTAAAVGVAGCGALSNGRVETYATSADWRFIHHDTRHTGFNPHASGPKTAPTERWSIPVYGGYDDWRCGYLGAPTPVIVNDRVYVGGEQLSAHRVADGSELWAVGETDSFHGLAYTGGKLYTSTWQDDKADPAIAAYTPSGTRQWHKSFDTAPIRRLIVADGTIYTASGGDLLSLAASDGSEQWRLRAGSFGVLAAVTTAGLYTTIESNTGVAARNRNRGLLDTVTGAPPTPRWSHDFDTGRLSDGPVVANETILVPQKTEYYPYNSPENARLHAISLDGTRRWAPEVGTTATTPTVGTNTVYQKSATHPEIIDKGSYVKSHFDARIAAYDLQSGRERWVRKFVGLGDWRIPPVLADGILYVPLYDTTTDRCRLRALDASDGHSRWERTLDAPAYHLAAVDTTLYVSTSDGTLHALT